MCVSIFDNYLNGTIPGLIEIITVNFEFRVTLLRYTSRDCIRIFICGKFCEFCKKWNARRNYRSAGLENSGIIWTHFRAAPRSVYFRIVEI